MKKQLIGHKINDRGSTLIEVIVSVLLIGIAFAPLMSSLGNALKSNDRAENKLYADTVAENCMETVKAIGMAGLMSEDATPFSSDPLSTVTVRLDETIGNTKVFKVDNLKEGNGSYYAKIKVGYSDTGVSGEQLLNNVGNYKKVAALASGKTVQASLGSDTVSTDLQQMVTLAKAGGSWAGLTVDNMKEQVKSKKTVITVGKEPDTDLNYPGWYYVDYKNEYVVNNLRTGSKLLSGEGDTFEITGTNSRDHYNSVPETILVFGATVNNPEASHTSYSGVGGEQDDFVINNEVSSDDISVYLFLSGVDLSPEATHTGNVNISAPTNPGTISLYCPLSYTTPSGLKEKITSIYETAETGDITKIYDVEIEVYNSIDDLQVATLSSSVVSK